MSKELDYINERIERLEYHIAHPNEYNITPTIKVKINDGAVYKEEVAILKRIKQQLEAIDNSNPSEALEYLDQFINEMTYCLEHPKEYAKGYEKQIFWKYKNTFETTIKQALLKAQEPKHYLKWEDLEKFKDKDSVKVKMNDTELSLIIQIDCLNDIYVQLYKEKEDGNCVNLLSDFFRNKELFNNLRLEMLE